MLIIDCKGDICSRPVIKTQLVLASEKNISVKVIVDNVEAMKNIEEMVKNYCYDYSTAESNGCYEIIINKKESDEVRDGDTASSGTTFDGTVSGTSDIIITYSYRINPDEHNLD